MTSTTTTFAMTLSAAPVTSSADAATDADDVGAAAAAAAAAAASAAASASASAAAAARSAAAAAAATLAPTGQAAGLAILLWASEPASPHRLATPFFHAAAAAAFDLPVEIYFSARSVLLLQPGVAASLRASERASTIHDAIRLAVGHGALLFACSDALEAQGLSRSALIPECTRRGGAVQFVARVTDLRWRTLVF